MVTRKDSNNRDTSFAYLNLLKILCVLPVFLIHWPQSFELAKPTIDGSSFLYFLRNDTAVVGIYFLMSGIVFMLAYYNKFINNKTTLKEFFKKRFIRLYPLVAIMIIITFLFNETYMYFNGNPLPNCPYPHTLVLIAQLTLLVPLMGGCWIYTKLVHRHTFVLLPNCGVTD